MRQPDRHSGMATSVKTSAQALFEDMWRYWGGDEQPVISTDLEGYFHEQ